MKAITLWLVLALSIACSQSIPIPTSPPPTTTHAPLWRASEAIALAKDRCSQTITTPLGAQVSRCQQEIFWLRDVKWTARYHSEERRWEVTASGLETGGVDKRLQPVSAYVYENTQVVEWIIGR
jgi:hypothetical protein